MIYDFAQNLLQPKKCRACVSAATTTQAMLGRRERERFNHSKLQPPCVSTNGLRFGMAGRISEWIIEFTTNSSFERRWQRKGKGQYWKIRKGKRTSRSYDNCGATFEMTRFYGKWPALSTGEWRPEKTQSDKKEVHALDIRPTITTYTL